MRRDARYESEWLHQALDSVGAGADEDFVDAVRARLVKGAREYGDHSYLTRSIDDLLAEIAEEGLDVAGWGVITAQRLYATLDSGELDGDQVQALNAHLIETAAHGYLVWRCMQT